MASPKSNEGPGSKPAAETQAARSEWAAESILDDERLTADLDDAAATLLIDWALAWVGQIAAESGELGEAQPPEALTSRLKAARRAMRLVNKWAGGRAALDPAQERELLAKIQVQARIAAGQYPENQEAVSFGSDDFIDRARSLTGDGADRVAGLRAILEKRANDAQTGESS